MMRIIDVYLEVKHIRCLNFMSQRDLADRRTNPHRLPDLASAPCFISHARPNSYSEIIP